MMHATAERTLRKSVRMMMQRSVVASTALCIMSSAAIAQVTPYPAGFRTQEITTNGATLHVRVGGTGPAVVLLHGFGDTGDMWAPLAKVLVHDHTVIVPDLRGMGLSSHPAGGYDKKTEAGDIAGVMDALHVQHADVVAHDIGNMVAFAFAARYPSRISRLVLMDAPLPGVGDWDAYAHEPRTWHFYFYGPDEERLVAGRERIYLDRFWNEFSANPAKVDEQTRAHYASLYSRPGAIHSAFSQFAAFPQDAKDNRASLTHGKLATPVLAIGGGNSYGTTMATVARVAFTNVRGTVIPNAGHWLMEEQPELVVKAVQGFLD
jgi:pimeloyl-ACP methyl ester carboxylesterase